MKRRSFIKNIGALSIASQIGITKALPESKEDVIHDFILQNDEGQIKMKLLEINQIIPEGDYVPLTYDTIHIKAIINDYDMSSIMGKMELIYEPDENTTMSANGLITGWSVDSPMNGHLEVEFYFKVS